MDFPKDRKSNPESDDETQVRLLYQTLLEAWNDKDAHEMAELFSENGNVIGFDGSQMDGRKQIESVLGQIFADHPTPVYVAVVRGVRFLAPGVGDTSRRRRDGAARPLRHQSCAQRGSVINRD